MDDLKPFIDKLSHFLDRLEPLLPPSNHNDINFINFSAYRWVSSKGYIPGFLQVIEEPASIRFEQLIGVEDKVHQIRQNTRQFLKGLPANNVLLTGARGTGKSSLIKACLTEYASDGLKMVEIDRDDLIDLARILLLLKDQPYKFILFCDDLSFEEGDASYKSLKALLDGSLMNPPENILIYASSNRRHLLPEYMSENEQVSVDQRGEIHQGEALEEKISLSERFGLWISFYSFTQKEYLSVVQNWLSILSPNLQFTEETITEALQFALQRGSRSGRVAQQFVRNYIGTVLLDNKK